MMVASSRLPRRRRMLVLDALALLVLQLAAPLTHAADARGVVYHDVNANGTRDANEPGIGNVRVSNGRDIVVTNSQGQYRIPITDLGIIFVVKPRDWMPPVDDNQLPQFYYVHRPQGSPKLKYAGLSATGPLPKAIDFPLRRNSEPEQFRVIVWADPQVKTRESVSYLYRDVIPELVETDAAFGVTLGDIVYNDLSLFAPTIEAVGRIGLPWYNVIGNHDLNFDSTSPETFIRHFGPRWFSFDYGQVHFIVLDDTQATGKSQRPRYEYRLGEQQLSFVRNDLQHVPRDRLIVLMMHAAFSALLHDNEREARDLFALFNGRENVVALAGHNHRNLYHWFGREAHWPNERPLYQRVLGAISGTWWSGPTDEFQIPIAVMRDGTPRGYFLLTFQGNSWSYRYKAIRRPAAEQMHIYVPPQVPLKELEQTAVLANVYAGNDRSVTELRVDKGAWRKMTMARERDPYYARSYQALMNQATAAQDASAARRLSGIKPARSTHLWKSYLPQDLSVGTHVIEVRSTDMFGQTWSGRALFRVNSETE